jgi:hypothetical protein
MTWSMNSQPIGLPFAMACQTWSCGTRPSTPEMRSISCICSDVSCMGFATNSSASGKIEARACSTVMYFAA